MRTPSESDGVAFERPTRAGTVPTPVTSPEPDRRHPRCPRQRQRSHAAAVTTGCRQEARSGGRRKKTRHDNQMDLFADPARGRSKPGGTRRRRRGGGTSRRGPFASTGRAPSAFSGIEPAEPEQQDKPVAEATGQAPAAPKTAPKPKEEKPARPLPAPPPVNPAQLRKAVNLILPLFTGQDPGARDCLKDNRSTFRSAFAPEAYVEFEQSVKDGDFDCRAGALEESRQEARDFCLACSASA